MNQINLNALSQLVNRFQNGDTEAFADIYTMYAQSIYYLCLKYVGKPADAEDVSQEAFIKIYRSMPKLREPYALDRFIYVTAVNCAKDFLRKNYPVAFSALCNGDETENIESLFAPEVFDGTKAPVDIVAEKETAAKLSELIDELPVGQRTVIMHFYFGGLKIPEIAQIEGISENAVKSRIYSARETLNIKATRLEDSGYRLRGMLPFLPIILREASKLISFPPKMSQTVLRATLGRSLPSVSAKPTAPRPSITGATEPGTVAASGAKKGLFASLWAKITAAIVAIAILAGGAIGVVSLTSGDKNSDDKKVSDNQNDRDDSSTDYDENDDEGEIIASGICGAHGDNLEYKLFSDGELKISGAGAMRLESIGDYGRKIWSYYSSEIKKVTIAQGVTTIDFEAFYGCDSLTSVTIPDSVVTIGHRAFADCESLSSVTIPDSVVTVDLEAFNGCEALASITLPEHPINIEENAFDGTAYYNDKSNWEGDVLYIGRHLYRAEESIGNSYSVKDDTLSVAANAFSNCKNLASITLPDCTTSIGECAFEGTAYYDNASNWDGDVLYIGKHLIDTKPFVKNISIKDGTLSIASEAFIWQGDIKSIVIPDSVISIGDAAFEYCNDLETITIPDSVTSLGYYIFKDCDNLTSVNISNDATVSQVSPFPPV